MLKGEGGLRLQRCLQISEIVGWSDLEYFRSYLCRGERLRMAREREKSSQSCEQPSAR